MQSPFALQFGTKAIRMIDFESARSYWLRGIRPSYMDGFEAEVDRMRLNGVTIFQSEALTQYRILHPYPLMVTGRVAKIPDDAEIN